MAQDLDKCDEQLATAKESIANTKIDNDRRETLIATAKKAYDDAVTAYEDVVVSVLVVALNASAFVAESARSVLTPVMPSTKVT